MGNEELLRWKNLQTFFKAYNHIINKNKLDVFSGAKIFQKNIKTVRRQRTY